MNNLLQKYRPLIFQFGRFFGIGLLNTGVTYVVTNIFIAATGIASGWRFSVITVAAFFIAVLHSFYWNKSWAFAGTNENFGRFLLRAGTVGGVGILVILGSIYGSGKNFGTLYFVLFLLGMAAAELAIWPAFHLKIEQGAGIAQTMGVFIGVTAIGAVIQGSLSGIISKYPLSFFAENPHLWANIALAVATLVSLVWNFIGYKLFVFKESKPRT